MRWTSTVKRLKSTSLSLGTRQGNPNGLEMGRCSLQVPETLPAGTWGLSPGFNTVTTASLLTKSFTTNKTSYYRVNSLTRKNDHLILHQITNAHGVGLSHSNSVGSGAAAVTPRGPSQTAMGQV